MKRILPYILKDFLLKSAGNPPRFWFMKMIL